MPHSIPGSLRSTLIRAAVSLAVLGPVASAQAESVVGLLSNNRLFTFDSATPGTAGTPVAVSGLEAGDALVGIDTRPTTGLLYGLAFDGSLYTLNATTGVATSIGSVSLPTSGSAIGIDFNPVPDLGGLASLRLMFAGANLRINVNGAPVTNVDTPLNGATASLAAVAYTNNDRDPSTGTALYGISGGNLYQVTNPNGGTTALIGSLGVTTADAFTGFDVSALGGTFASLTAPGAATSSFYSINLASGAATLLGAFNANLGAVVDISATAIAPAIPEPGTYALMLAGLVGVGAIARRRRAR